MSSTRIPVIALLAAAGRGTRLGGPIPKAFVTLRERTLLERSLQAMLTSESVDEIIILVSPDMETYARDLLRKRGLLNDPEGVRVRLVHGGGERADSVWAGLQAISLDDATPDAIVLIHDSARALTPPGMIARVVRKVHEGATAVIPVLPVSDTIKRVSPDGGVVVDTPNRAELRAVQTPQGFRLSELVAANEKFFADPNPGFIPTDDASLMEWYGADVVCVQGDPMAFKVTTPIDMMLAQRITDEAEPTIFEVPGD
ncbi:2-C-methyl-D-erythritol 4-phosphate cytidylyltransferase [Corynebacterium glutamicum]|uniref:2-C-methyl-D-erythritol 4-phosphate cytidylyltransferase n=1 Tax=Corynebacterium glutamicum TaxID=1718 RepID=UPI0004F7EBEA|nr:2-C-methyl-D-erythritol 4-phosphate cytidylyltransferase [Corynebacterium glutamicum]AIK86073.1 2-C-methyl-D-erythritol 4-phosphate cytidylyltransferase [Corynebacterium glutamicum]AIK88856.1 2-C-methyl-D-erythritol 4-phosphate cytidylyltransferase [Corynebacterium glutamicum]ALP51057.1 2-C-methyl-D-erythritol 4-phosphate cytidylyltransferase [Corynebacterium glutamicum]AMA01086.1 2-C-methyl-D-erythritol 4-phosphate cytidylyltransferase [Corynebacterium glutamicum]ANU34583.1 2-C-methyl-D-er